MKVGVEGSLKSLEVLKKRRQPPERHRMFFVTAASQKLSVIRHRKLSANERRRTKLTSTTLSSMTGASVHDSTLSRTGG